MTVKRKPGKNFFASILLLTSWFLTAASQGQEYRADPDWPQPLPDGIEWGQVPNVTIDKGDYIYAFHRAQPPGLKFDASGKLVDTFDEPAGSAVDVDGDVYTGKVIAGETGDGMIRRKFIKQ